MKRTFKTLTFIFAAGWIALGGCKKKDDEKPVIKLVSPKDLQEFHPGETIKFEAVFTDNKNLAEYRIDIHKAGDHSHKTANADWDYEKTGELKEKTQTVTFDINIPADADHGVHDFLLECTDKAGNEADHVVVEIHIEEEH